MLSEKRAGHAEALLDALAAAALLLTGGGRVAHMNRAAAQLVGAADGLRIEAGGLTTSDAAHAVPFHRFLDAASRTAPGAGSGIALPRADGRPPLQVLATPLAGIGAPGAEPALVVLAADPLGVVCLPDAVLRALYGLTPAEIEIANGLLAGYSIEEIAARRQVTVGTARQQLKRTLHKTGSARQSDFVRRLMSLPRFRMP
ncbi:MAG TPA: hypothetical protein VIC54_10080 [Terriglobales bacterium]